MMAVIKARSGRLFKAGITGAAIVFVPAIIVCIVLIFLIVKKNQMIADVNTELDKYKEGTICILQNDMERGQEIKLEDLIVVKGMFYENVNIENPKEYVGMYMKTDAKAGAIISDCVIENERSGDEEVRTYFVDYIDLPDSFSDEMYFDIRIVFPNGEDYLVAGNKRADFIDEEGFYVDLTRREALLLSSAKVDLSIYAGTRLYAAFYTAGFEETEIQTYPVNSYVFSLGQWEPNLEETFPEEMFTRRQILEKNLLEFMGVTNNIQ